MYACISLVVCPLAKIKCKITEDKENEREKVNSFVFVGKERKAKPFSKIDYKNKSRVYYGPTQAHNLYRSK
jgi:hypothetical protein